MAPRIPTELFELPQTVSIDQLIRGNKDTSGSDVTKSVCVGVVVLSLRCFRGFLGVEKKDLILFKPFLYYKSSSQSSKRGSCIPCVRVEHVISGWCVGQSRTRNRHLGANRPDSAT